MDKKLFRSLLLLITYAIVLVAVIVKIDAVTGWLGGVLSAFKPLIIGLVIAFILDRPCNFFARHYEKVLPGKAKKAARPLAAATAYLVVVALITALISLVVPELIHSIETFVNNISTYAANFQDLYDWVVAKLDLEQMANLDLSAGISDTLKDVLNGALDALTNTLPHLIGMTSVLISGVVTGAISLVFSVYMLSGGPKLVAQCRRLVTAYLPERISRPALSVTRLTVDTFTKFISGQVVEAFILGGLCFAGMCIFRFDYAPLISVIVGVSALIPVAGAYLGAGVSAVLLVMIEPIQALWFLVFLVTLQQLEGNIIYPRVVGTSMGLPGIWVLAAVTVGGALLGLAGIVVSVPITAVLYTLLKRDLRERIAVKASARPAGEGSDAGTMGPPEEDLDS